MDNAFTEKSNRQPLSRANPRDPHAVCLDTRLIVDEGRSLDRKTLHATLHALVGRGTWSDGNPRFLASVRSRPRTGFAAMICLKVVKYPLLTCSSSSLWNMG